MRHVFGFRAGLLIGTVGWLKIADRVWRDNSQEFVNGMRRLQLDIAESSALL